MNHFQPLRRDKGRMNSIVAAGFFFAALIQTRPAHADTPAAIAAPDQTLVATIHAEGAQVYECAAGAAGQLAWQFREPVATLLLEGKTVGRHYAGPNWELADGSAVVGKVAGRAPGATARDIPLLKLDVVSQRGSKFADVTTIQRLNTKGGVAEGPCPRAGEFLSVPYSADYAFLTKARWSLVPATEPDKVQPHRGRP